jgi:hypothetical protein
MDLVTIKERYCCKVAAVIDRPAKVRKKALTEAFHTLNNAEINIQKTTVRVKDLLCLLVIILIKHSFRTVVVPSLLCLHQGLKWNSSN